MNRKKSSPECPYEPPMRPSLGEGSWNVDVSDEDMKLIRAIHVRILEEFQAAEPHLASNALAVARSIQVVHASHEEGLDLERLLGAPVSAFLHDLIGINDFADPETGRLTGHFVPRCGFRGKAYAQ